jgi:hypothetical protein
MTGKEASNQNFIRIVALTIVVVGAVGSLYFMFNAGRHQKSILLIALFMVWVLSPFVIFIFANKISNRWTVPARATLYWATIVLAVGSLIVYSGTFNTAQTKPASIFLIVPFISWLLILAVALVVRRLSRKTN